MTADAQLRVYVALVELTPLEGCELISEGQLGGFARIYVPAADAGQALARINRAAEESLVSLVDILWCVDSEDDDEWESPHDEEAAACIDEARQTGRPMIGRLDTWSEDDSSS